MGNPPLSTQPSAVVRMTGVWWMFAVFYGIILLMAVGAAFNPSVAPIGRVACAVLAIAVVAFIVRARLAGIEATATVVTVRRYLGPTVTVPWADVAAIEPSTNGNGAMFVTVALNDGRRLRTQGAVTTSAFKLASAIVDLEEAREA